MNSYNKVEIILSDIHLEQLVEHLEALGITGYTTINIDKSKGPRKGEQQYDGLFRTTHNSLFFTITTETVTQSIIEKMQPFLDKRGGVLIVYPITYASGLTPSSNNK